MASVIKARSRRTGLPFGGATDYDLPLSRLDRRRSSRRDDDGTDTAALLLVVLPRIGDAVRTAWKVVPAVAIAVGLLIVAHGAVDAGRDAKGPVAPMQEPAVTGSVR
ncbi:MAG TPA: hypothetical protein VHL98_17315 [Microvirga sp.]|jgi:hypothetical protein|nr:hypothetical protein [Microvirga sp.]